MLILGIRNSIKFFRYCILEQKNNAFVFCNKNSEHKILVPPSLKGNEVFVWYKQEIERLLDYGAFDGIAIKHNENNASCYSKLKSTMFFDCISTIVALDNNIKTKSYIYNQLHVNKSNVINKAESLVGKTAKYWDTSIADAIVAAYNLSKELGN